MKKEEKGNGLYWVTATETNNGGFEVQKSVDGRDPWQNIIFVEGRGNTSQTHDYYYLDTSPFPGVNYYRLKQIDFDGAFEYSEIIAIEAENIIQKIKVFPNPSTGFVRIS